MTAQSIINDFMLALGGEWTLLTMHPIAIAVIIIVTVILKKLHIIR